MCGCGQQLWIEGWGVGVVVAVEKGCVGVDVDVVSSCREGMCGLMFRHLRASCWQASQGLCYEFFSFLSDWFIHIWTEAVHWLVM